MRDPENEHGSSLPLRGAGETDVEITNTAEPRNFQIATGLSLLLG